MKEQLSYEKAGVNIEVADATKKAMSKSLETTNKRVLNKIGAFASLFDGIFPEYEHTVLVLKTEEPGSKQKLSFQYNRISSICYAPYGLNDLLGMIVRANKAQITKEIYSEKVERWAKIWHKLKIIPWDY